jgi:acyl-CoA hydrolase
MTATPSSKFDDALAAPSVTRMTDIVMPEHLNHRGTLFGGVALSMMDRSAFVAATRHSRQTVVTVGVDEVDYVAPVHIGEIVDVLAEVTATGRTSMTIEVTMVAEVLLSGERRLCGTGRFVFVAIGPDDRPVAVPQVVPTGA